MTKKKAVTMKEIKDLRGGPVKLRNRDVTPVVLPETWGKMEPNTKNLYCGSATVKPSRKKYTNAHGWAIDYEKESPFVNLSNFSIKDACEHNKYHALAHKIADIVTEKQLAYGDSFGRAGAVMRELYPNGIRPDQYDDMLTIIRVIDKLFRVANNKDAFGESPFSDICGYSLLEVVKDYERKNQTDR